MSGNSYKQGSSSSKGKACRSCDKLDLQINEAKEKVEAMNRNAARRAAELAALDAKEARLNFLMNNMAMLQGKTKSKKK